MPFGLCNAPGTFQRLMEHVLQGLHLSTSLVYLIIFSTTHLTRFADVLTRLRQVGLKVKPSKYHLMKNSVPYLGHMVSSEEIETDLAKIQCITDGVTPTNGKELKQFLGLASYYWRFVRGVTKIASSLHHLSEKTKPGLVQIECFPKFRTYTSNLWSQHQGLATATVTCGKDPCKCSVEISFFAHAHTWTRGCASKLARWPLVVSQSNSVLSLYLPELCCIM